MNTKCRDKIKILLLLTAMLLSLAACCVIYFGTAVQADETVQETTVQENEKKLVITVVGDIPAEDIDDSAIPMAAPGSKEASAFWRTFPFVIIPVIIIVIIVSVRVRYIKRKQQLRQLIDGFDEDSDDFGN